MGDGSSGAGGAGNFRKMWAGLHFAADMYLFKSDNSVCSITNLGNHNYSCYAADGKTPLFNATDPTSPDYDQHAPIGVPSNSVGMGKINGGPKLATKRLLASFDYAINSNIMIGGRIGFAFGGGPKSYNYSAVNATLGTIKEGKAFFPVHIEPRVTYHFVSLGKPGLHPYIHLGGGIAQVDAQMKVQVCGTKSCFSDVDNKQKSVRDVVVWKRVGTGFVDVGGGVLLPIGKSFGAQVNVNLMYMLPDSGIVIEPSLGAVMGF
jgi:hypothetical protein